MVTAGKTPSRPRKILVTYALAFRFNVCFTYVMGRIYRDYIGRTFGLLTVVDRAGVRARQTLWLCRCECGVEIVERRDRLRMGKRTACWRKNHPRPPSPKTLPQLHPVEYDAWMRMRERCNNPNRKGHKHYGGRGIKICPQWDSFAQFLADMGSRPPDKPTLERLDVNGDYEPSNCAWATWAEQRRNQRNSRYVEWQGERVYLKDLAKRHKLSLQLVGARLKMGWSLEKALTTPVHRKATQYAQPLTPRFRLYYNPPHHETASRGSTWEGLRFLRVPFSC